MEQLMKVLQGFAISGLPVSCERYGQGHINDTYLVVTDNGCHYILQRINHHVFRDVPALMNNIEGVTSFIFNKLQEQGKSAGRALRLIKTVDGRSFGLEGGCYYRIYNFIDNAESIEIPSHPHLMYLCGKGYGNFQKLLNGYPADSLSESIPRFHDTEDRYEKFLIAQNKDQAGRVSKVAREIDFYKTRAAYCGQIKRLIESGEMPLRVTHNDTKLNNVLIDLEKDEAAAVIDLDTVMPGSIVYDFGDGIRSGANMAAEDEQDLSKVGFNIEMYRSFAEGFLDEVGEVVTEVEKQHMAFGALLMTYECGMRFLTDYLEGDKYFRIHREGHNLDRARTQMKLVTEIEKNIDEMNRIVRNYADKNKSCRTY
ncbi:MAG: aminoglycoside phosphotransferase family protein [Clostridia bacterium]|nr:aminoglycoside phosphotransferase family protein [Clostridia bacterium]